MAFNYLDILKVALGSFSVTHPAASINIQKTNILESLAHDLVGALTLINPLNDSKFNFFAGHRSHSSHSSHRSHSSHSSHYSSSSSSGSRYYSAPVSPPPPRPSIAPAVTPYQSLSAPVRPTPDQLSLFLMRVQAALYSRGYDPGGITGVMNESTRSALRRFQSAHGLPVSGLMTTETLTALGVSLQ
jgi:His-Xaa-Ser repeat protein HxsA